MSEPEKNGSKIAHAHFRNADALAERAKAEHRKVDEAAEWRQLATKLVDWIISKFK